MNSNPNSNGLLIGIVIVLVILVGLAFLLDNSTSDEDTLQNTATNNRNEENSQNQANDGITFTTTTTTSTTTSGGSPTDTAFTIKTDDLSPEQKAMLTASGFEGSDIVITNEMKACAEQSIGTQRTQEFAEGQKPTVIEAGKLLVCYNQ